MLWGSQKPGYLFALGHTLNIDLWLDGYLSHTESEQNSDAMASAGPEGGAPEGLQGQSPR